MKHTPTLSPKKRFLAIALVCCIIVSMGGYLLYNIEKDKIRSEKQLEFEAIAKLKSNQVEYWRSERRFDAEFFSSYLTFPYLKSLLNNSEAQGITHLFINHILRNKQYDNLIIISHKGEPLYNYYNPTSALDPLKIENALRTIDLQRISIGRFYFHKTSNKIYYDLFAPIYDNNKPAAVAIIRVNPDVYLFPIISEWPSASETAETFIVRQDQDSILFLNTTKGYTNAQLNTWIQTFKHKANSDSLQYGKVFEKKDFKGNNTLTYIHKIPLSPWYLISKIDANEIYADIRTQTLLIAISTLLLMLLIGITLGLIYSYRQKIIQSRLLEKERELNKTQDEYKATLYSIGDGVVLINKREIIEAINPIAEQLLEISEKDALGKRFEEIFTLIDETSRNPIQNPISSVLSNSQINTLKSNTVLVNLKGKEIPIAESAAPIKNHAGELTGVVMVFNDQTAERHQQKSLKESELRFSRLFENAPLAYQSLDQNGGIVEVNKAWLETFGYSASEVNGKPFVNFIAPNEVEAFTKKFPSFIEQGKVYAEMKIKHKNGSELLVAVNGQIGYNSDGAFDKTHCIVQDITLPRRMEEKLRESEKKFKGLFNKHSAAKIIIDPKTGRITDANDAAEAFYGWTLEQLKTKTIFEINTLPQSEVLKKIELALDTNNIHFEFIHRRADGSTVDVEVYSSTIEIGGTPYIYSIIHDISKKVEFEKALHHSEQRLRLILDTTAEGIYAIDNLGRCTSINRAALDMLGFDNENELLGKNIHSITHHSYPNGSPYPEHECKVHETFKKGIRNHTDKDVFWKKDNESIQVEYWSYPIIENNETKGSVVSFLDITERKRAEEEHQKNYTLLKIAGETAKFGGWYVDLVNEQCVWSDEVAEIHGEQPGYSPSLKVAIGYYLPDHKERLTTLFYNCSNLGVAFDDEFQIKTAKGSIIWVRAIGKALRDESGKITRVYGSFQDINSFKEAEQKVEQSRKTMDRLIGNLSGIAYRSKLDRDWTIEYISQGCETMTGYSDNEFYKKDIRWGEVIIEEDRDYVYNEIEKNVTQDKYFQIEYRIRNKNGKTLWVWEKGCGVYDEEGKLQAIEGFITDITERKNTEAALIESEIFQKALIDSSPIAIYSLDTKGTIITWNKAAELIFGWTLNEVVGKPNPIVQKGKEEEFQNNMNQILKGQGFRGKEFIRQRKNGERIIISLSTAPIYKNKQAVGVMAVAEAITERKKTEESLRESEEKLSGILNNITDVVWSLTWPDMKPLYLSPSVETLYGRSVNNFLENPSLFIETVHPDDQHLTKNALKQLQEMGESVRECRIIRPDGNITWIYDKSKLVYDENKRPVRVEGIAHDITKRKQAEEELIAFKNDLEIKVQEKTKELNERIEELEDFYNATIDRELRMKELKDEIKRLKEGNA